MKKNCFFVSDLYRVMSKGKVLLCMSGGIDSSVAAMLLLDQGYDILWSDLPAI
jgi:tRNA(Ile)-lysidine synthase TilS/MesJ